MSQLTVAYDPRAGVLRTISSGFLTVDDVRLWGANFAREMMAARSATGKVLHLVNAVEAPVQSAEVIEAFAKIDFYPKEPGDRMALVLSSNLAKMQAARNFVSDRQKGFLDEAEAIAWLRNGGAAGAP